MPSTGRNLQFKLIYVKSQITFLKNLENIRNLGLKIQFLNWLAKHLLLMASLNKCDTSLKVLDALLIGSL